MVIIVTPKQRLRSAPRMSRDDGSGIAFESEVKEQIQSAKGQVRLCRKPGLDRKRVWEMMPYLHIKAKTRTRNLGEISASI